MQYPSKFDRNPYLIPQSGQQMMEEPLYREQPQMTRQDWPQIMQQQPVVQVQLGKQQTNSIWPEKIVKQAPAEEKAARKKGQNSEYSDEYVEGDENQAESDDATTTEAPKKVRKFCYSFKLNSNNFFFSLRKIASTRK